jgi:hypothetical protein
MIGSLAALTSRCSRSAGLQCGQANQVHSSIGLAGRDKHACDFWHKRTRLQAASATESTRSQPASTKPGRSHSILDSIQFSTTSISHLIETLSAAPVCTITMTSKQSVLITGCSNGGIGSVLALQFQQRGFHVFVTARDPSKVSELSALSDVTVLTLDVVKSDDIKAAVDAVAKQTNGTLDYLISNAGRNHFMPILDEDPQAIKNVFDINLLGPIALTQAFAPLLIKAKGMIVYITSISGYLNIPFMGMYFITCFTYLR